MYNQVFAAGYLATDPKITFHNGLARVFFTLGCTTRYGQNLRTDYINCIAWGALAEWCNKHLRTGYGAFVTGKLRTYKETLPDGYKVYTNVVANRVLLLSTRKMWTDRQGQQASQHQTAKETQETIQQLQEQEPPEPQEGAEDVDPTGDYESKWERSEPM